jgi:hypothetical protein
MIADLRHSAPQPSKRRGGAPRRTAIGLAALPLVFTLPSARQEPIQAKDPTMTDLPSFRSVAATSPLTAIGGCTACAVICWVGGSF